MFSRSRPSSTRDDRPPRGALWFAGLFIVVGSLVFVWLFILPVVRVIGARGWPEVPCVIESSFVKDHPDADGTTYSFEVRFHYEFQGRPYQSDRYSLAAAGVSTSGRARKDAMVAHYPAGSTAVCYVNPRQPSVAVLRRDVEPQIWMGLFPLVFVAVGTGLLLHLLRQRRIAQALSSNPPPIPFPSVVSSLTARHDASPDATPLATAHPGPSSDSSGTPLVLDAGVSPLGRVFLLMLVALFWNGIVAVFVSAAVSDFRRGSTNWFVCLFLVPFVGVGLFLLGMVVHAFATLFNPRPRLTVQPGRLALGNSTQIAWSFRGNTDRLQRLQIHLEGREVARYRRGTDTVTDESLFAEIVLADTRDRAEIRHGEITVDFPTSATPSFKAANNELAWQLVLRGDIEWWADVDEKYPIHLAPPPITEPSPAPATTGQLELVASPNGRSSLGVRGGQRAFRPGEIIEGGAGWSLDRPPREAEVRLFCYTSGKGTRDTRVEQVQRFTDPKPQDVRAFQFIAPSSPWSCDGRLVSVQWAIELILGDGKEAVRWDLVISPSQAPWPLPALPSSKRSKARWSLGSRSA